MDSSSWLKLILFLVALLAGCYFAASETSLAAMNKIRMKNQAENGDGRAKKAMFISSHFDKALTTILIGNNIAHIGCSSLATLLALHFWGEWAVSYTTLVVTLVVFMFSETIPKSYARATADTTALTLSPSLFSLMKFLTPVSFFFLSIGKLASRVFVTTPKPTVTEEELKSIIENIDEDGALAPQKSELVQSAMDFNDITVQDVLTPRVDIVGLDVDMNDEEIMQVIRENKYSRLPVYADSIDHIVGVVHIRRYLKHLVRDGKANLQELMDKPYYIPMTIKIDDLLREMSNRKLHMAIVTDEYGGTLGVVTVEDILEELVGEIWDEDDVVVEDFIHLGGERYEVGARMLILDALDQMDYSYSAQDEAELEHKIVGAWTLELCDAMPEEGDVLYWKNLEVEVKHIDSQRITKVIIRPRKIEQ